METLLVLSIVVGAAAFTVARIARKVRGPGSGCGSGCGGCPGACPSAVRRR